MRVYGVEAARPSINGRSRAKRPGHFREEDESPTASRCAHLQPDYRWSALRDARAVH